MLLIYQQILFSFIDKSLRIISCHWISSNLTYFQKISTETEHVNISRGDPENEDRKHEVKSKILVHNDSPKKITGFLFKLWRHKIDWAFGQYQGGKHDASGVPVDQAYTLYGHRSEGHGLEDFLTREDRATIAELRNCRANPSRH